MADRATRLKLRPAKKADRRLVLYSQMLCRSWTLVLGFRAAFHHEMSTPREKA
jgi:hypothetical protein